MPRKLQKWIVPFLLLPNFGRVARPQTPISQPSTPQNSTSAPLFRCPEPPFLIPQNTIWDVPFCHLGYIFGTFAHNVQPRCLIWLLRFRCKSMCVFFSVQENRLAYPTAKIFILYMAKERKSFYIFVQ